MSLSVFDLFAEKSVSVLKVFDVVSAVSWGSKDAVFSVCSVIFACLRDCTILEYGTNVESIAKSFL